MATEVADWHGCRFPGGVDGVGFAPAVREVLSAAPLVQTPETRPQLLDWALGRTTGATDWRLGNRDDHGVYEAVFKARGRAASWKPSSPRRAMAWPSISLILKCGAAILMRW